MQFQAGLAFMTGPPGQPLRAGASVIDIMGAVFGVIAAQAALREREATGKGQRVCSALFESAAFLMSTHMAGMAATGLPARPMPARRGAWAIYEVFPTAGGGSCSSASPATSNGPASSRSSGCRSWPPIRASPPTSCAAHERAWLIPALQEVVATLPQDEVARRCERANISWAPVGQPGDLFTDPHLLATGGLLDVFISRFGGGEGKKVGLPALPVEFGDDRASAPASAASRRAWASTTPRSSGRPGFPQRRLPHWPKNA